MDIRSFFNLKFRSGAKLVKPNHRIYRLGSIVCDLTVPGGFYGSSNFENLKEITREYLDNNAVNDFHNQLIKIDRLSWPYHTIIPYPGTYDYYGQLIMKVRLIPYAKDSDDKRSLSDIKNDIFFRYDDFYNAKKHDPETGRGYNKHQAESVYKHYTEEVILGNEELREELIQKRISETIVRTPEVHTFSNNIMYEASRSLTKLKNNYCFLFNEYCYLSIEINHDGWNERYFNVCFENAKKAEDMIISSVNISEFLDQTLS
ncbi:hypothetical protein [Vibrio sp. B1FLJ16]|uniref:hypothetical protein n=1 Tax=Vibrio sp. B1FLJ16 TaxID=2751178 RepID=UPI0015F536E9|nr:hypothetical protein [Vibrio sp. B1FLJ16]CAD7824336.1 hypothetical protein ACOMICROBIO_EPCKBFOG_04542 [Vibrio sp. B1FLJ16]CAE6954313.1 hypothetical protein ACOMICROBIO_EPCKBFOG_04542 [Vibrio sp. B1FLJ16]